MEITNEPNERGPLTENVTLDDERDLATIYGVMVAGEVLRAFTQCTPNGKWFRVVNVHSGVSTIETRCEQEFSKDSSND